MEVGVDLDGHQPLAQPFGVPAELVGLAFMDIDGFEDAVAIAEAAVRHGYTRIRRGHEVMIEHNVVHML